MTTATKSRPRKQAQRTMQFINTGIVMILWIKQGNKTDSYMVEDTSTDNNCGQPTYQLTKTDGTVYNVLLDGPDSLCDCIGFEHRGMSIKGGCGCKHIAALTKLHGMGRI